MFEFFVALIAFSFVSSFLYVVPKALRKFRTVPETDVKAQRRRRAAYGITAAV